MSGLIVVVMGVAGCGKSTIGQRLAELRGVAFIEGDEFHPQANVRKMAAGIALTDADRQGWLQALSGRMREARALGQGLVVSCSALKRAYRDVLRQGAPDLVLVYLEGSPALVASRLASRTEHYMPAALLDSQFEILQPPQADEHALAYSVEASPDTLTRQVAADLAALDATLETR